MAVKFVIVTFALVFCCAAQLVEDEGESPKPEEPDESYYSYGLLVTKLDTLKKKLAKLDNIERKLNKLDDVEQQLSRIEQTMANSVFESCSAEPSKMSGKYRLQPNVYEQSFVGFCEQEKYGGGWLVIQHRFDGSVNFYRNWTDYKNGFGKIDGEFWIGLERLHKLTKDKNVALMVEIEDYDGNYGFARYENFEIGGETEKYVLKRIDGHSGSLQDSMSNTKGSMFTTRDSNNDKNGSANCAQLEKGAWWYNNCSHTNPNGPFQKQGAWQKIYWYKHEGGVQLKFFRMMIK
ncbi:angiopoietin-related protein 1 [Aedes albopictus]|uniref:Fibrinogen C-terminal domain-containing protein n=1 Tax=Aedes albopictus TaxID=7160 RepID=A0ABM1Y932_AEDAL|nr:angiopoietin-related protein 1-like [Aedes albopictus]